jgi:lipoprotein NlpI
MPDQIEPAKRTLSPASGWFVGRERERREFRNSVRYVLKKESPPDDNHPYPHIFLLHGEGGIGKTELLRQFVQIARQEGLPESQIVVLNLDSDSYPTALGLAQKIAGALRRTNPEFDQRYRAALDRRRNLLQHVHELKQQWARWEQLRGSSAEEIDKLLEAYRRTLRHLELQLAVKGQDAAPHIATEEFETRNKLAALLDFRQDPGHLPNTFQELLERELGAEDAALFLHERGLGQALADDLHALAKDTPLLLALDPYELADQHVDWLRTTILASIIPNMLVIISSRNRHDKAYRRTFAGELAGLVRSYNLNDQTLQSDEVREYLRLRLATDPADELVNEVLQISRGIPLAVEVLRNQVAKGLDQREVVRHITKHFLHYAWDDTSADDAKQRDERRIRALSLLLRPDRELISALWGCTSDEAQQVVSQLAERYSFIFAYNVPYEMNDLVYKFVRTDTLNAGRNDYAWPMLIDGLRRALPVVDQRIALAEQRLPDPDERYADAEWREATLDRLNILLWLDDAEAAKRLLLNRWIEAQYLNAKLEEQVAKLIRQVKDLATELAPNRSDWNGLIKLVNSQQNIQDDNQLYARIIEYKELLGLYGKAILYNMRVQELPMPSIINESEWKLAKDYIELLEKGFDLDKMWHPIRIALIKAYNIRSRYAMQKEHYADALAAYDHLLELTPNDPDILSGRGSAKNWLQDYAGAKADFDLSLTLRPKDAETLTRRGIAKAGLGDYASAIDDYNNSLSWRPNDATTYSRRGKAKHASGKYTEENVLDDYKRALTIDQNHADTMYYLAGFYAGKNHPDATPSRLARVFGFSQHRSHYPVSSADDPIKWLAQAITLDKRIRDDASKNADLARILNDPRFVALVGDASAE